MQTIKLNRLAQTLLALSIHSSVFSAGGTGKYKLDWDDPSEYVEYHSCGCADTCWVAELRTKKRKALKLKLRCDCEKLYVTIGSKKPEQLYRENCQEFECDATNCKSELITKELKNLLKR